MTSRGSTDRKHRDAAMSVTVRAMTFVMSDIAIAEVETCLDVCELYCVLPDHFSWSLTMEAIAAANREANR